MNKIIVVGPRDKKPEGYVLVNTTSRSKETWEQQLSPFNLGPVDLYSVFKSRNVENAWQFSKVYKEFTDQQGEPTDDYFHWAQNGWNDHYAQRYPMGKGAVPEYCWWDGEKLGYVEARRRVYCPLYSDAVVKTHGFKVLQQMHKNVNLALFDFDGYDEEREGMSIDDVFNHLGRKAGHAFLLKRLLLNEDSST